MIVVDTGGIVALLDADDDHHEAVLDYYERTGGRWVLPWAILPEVDHLLRSYVGTEVADAFAEDVRDGLFHLDADVRRDLDRACEIMATYRDLNPGLVDALVMAAAEHHEAEAIVTVDGRDFRAVRLKLDPRPPLVPLDVA